MEVFLHRAHRLLSRCRRARRGSVTIEACISVVAFLFVMLAILFLINISRAQMLLQAAVDKAALEISQYMYLYKVSGLYDADITVQKQGQQAEDTASAAVNNAENLAAGLSALSDGIQKGGSQIGKDISSGDLPALFQTVKTAVSENKDAVQEIKANAGGLRDIFTEIKGDPVQFLKNVAALGVSAMGNEAKSFLFSLLAQALVEESLTAPSETADARLRALGVVDGVDGLDFSHTMVLDTHAASATPAQDVNIVVLYQVKLMPYLQVSFTRTFAQSASVRCWLGGDATAAKQNGAPQKPVSSQKGESQTSGEPAPAQAGGGGGGGFR